ncbi:effector binding domain-containing protein [Paenibacillus sp. LHD-117]|uniref:effector binding domain-containing protein n=1 Tax=Paenibacillus sp. LHD-117 TaxID=3071412 RepID=UPI0027E126BF|nr:effector binding domain-containing protein [Paenibacillus sp. LHD-117]MDQ6421263.1 effector binding domain-containing protein [Paenibacillus sp. LHD-117]
MYNSAKQRPSDNPDGYRPERVPAALKVIRRQSQIEVKKMEDMKPHIVEHDELKLIGIPCISLKDMSGKYGHAKEGLLSSTRHFPFVKNPSIHYGIWPEVPTQSESDMHAYILCVEVESFDGVPEWYFKTTLPPQKCVVVPNKSGDYDAACRVVDQYVAGNGMIVNSKERKYIICERYNYEGEGFSKYSLPIQTIPEGEQ